MQKENDSFSLLYNQLWLVDNAKLQQINPGLKVDNWLDLYNNSEAQMSKNSSRLVSNENAELYTQNIIETITTDPSILNISQSKTPLANLEVDSKPSINNNKDLITDWEMLVQNIKECTKCDLHCGRKNVVVERGNRNSRWMFIGEAPGENEDLQGLPFIGAAGELLNKMIAAMNLKLDEIYICNVIKCRPPYNRNPEPNEVIQCNNYLLSQINLVKPDIIITLGRFASHTILNTESAINKLRGKTHKFNNIPVIVTFHPSYLLRNALAKKDAWEDLQLAMRVYKDNENKN
ncbi:MAG: uracil-DNA glycosylase [Neisseriaceae bacterium]|jgi:uracil-DNA glycosylase family 4